MRGCGIGMVLAQPQRSDVEGWRGGGVEKVVWQGLVVSCSFRMRLQFLVVLVVQRNSIGGPLKLGGTGYRILTLAPEVPIPHPGTHFQISEKTASVSGHAETG
eukprot:808486-Rhodomonas_salina.2